MAANLQTAAQSAIWPDSAISLDSIARRIRERCERMNAFGADRVRLAMANGDDLIAGRAQFTEHGTWLLWLQEACKPLKQRQALKGVTLAQRRPATEAYLHRCANLGLEASISGALKFISPPNGAPKKPKKVSEIETPAVLGPFLNGHRDLFWLALQLAPDLKADIAQRLLPKTASTVKGNTDKALELMRLALAQLGNATTPNIEAARSKLAAAIARACVEPPNDKRIAA
jgi:hypothetical protein